MRAEAKRYEALTAEGMNSGTAERLTNALAALEPEAGKEQVSARQRYAAIMDAGLSESDQLRALHSVMDEDAWKTFETANRAGVTPEVYVEFLEETADLQADRAGNGKAIAGSKKQKVLAAIDALDITKEQKTALYYAAGYAESTLTEFLRLRALKRTRHGGEVILADWLEVWLRDFICPNREKTTVHGYENIIRLHLVPALGEVKLPELQPAQLQRYYAELLEKGLSHNTVRKHHVLLHTALEAAVRQGLLRENVTRYVTPPAKVLPSHRYYDPAQLRELFCRCAGTEIEPAVKLAGYLGLRRSEICGLKWRCVDLDAKIVTVREVRTSVGGTFIEKKPKSYSSVRRLCYDGVSDLEELLTRLHDEWERGQRERGTGFNPEGYVAVTEQGKPWDPNGLGRRVAAFVEENALPSISLHGLRHSFASVANSRSVPMFTISKALGHSSTSITSEVYTHLFDETVQDVVNVVAKAIGTRA